MAPNGQANARPFQLWFRVDASKRIGAGHFMRCLSLAERWQDEGGIARFIGDYPPELARRLEAEGIQHQNPGAIWPDPADLQETAALLPPGVTVVVDGYNFDAVYHDGVGGANRLVMVIDDIGHLPAYGGSVLLNFNMTADRVAYPVAPAQRLLGPGYVPLRRRFAATDRSGREIPRTARKLLVTLGGADPTGATPRVMRALSEPAFEGFSVRVIAGPAVTNLTEMQRIASRFEGRFELLADVADMAEQMAWADFAISAAGGTSWEMAFMGLPAGLIAVAENQKPNVRGLTAWGAVQDLTDILHPGNLATQVDAIVGDPHGRRRMSERGRELIDGLGAARVVERLRNF